jgi:Zn-dependent protease
MLNLTPAQILSRLIILLIALPVHELSHALAATLLGDDTARRSGRLTLNPLAHLDPIGAFMLVIAGFGWAKPVPINPYALERRSRYGQLLVALAGPLSNLALAILAAVPFRLGLRYFSASASTWLPSLPQFLAYFILINLALMLFNLLPIFPLDGEKVLVGALPPNLARPLESLRPYGSMILLGVIILGRFTALDPLGWLMGTPLSALFRLLTGS